MQLSIYNLATNLQSFFVKRKHRKVLNAKTQRKRFGHLTITSVSQRQILYPAHTYNIVGPDYQMRRPASYISLGWLQETPLASELICTLFCEPKIKHELYGQRRRVSKSEFINLISYVPNLKIISEKGTIDEIPKVDSPFFYEEEEYSIISLGDNASIFLESLLDSCARDVLFRIRKNDEDGTILLTHPDDTSRMREGLTTKPYLSINSLQTQIDEQIKDRFISPSQLYPTKVRINCFDVDSNSSAVSIPIVRKGRYTQNAALVLDSPDNEAFTHDITLRLNVGTNKYTIDFKRPKVLTRPIVAQRIPDINIKTPQNRSDIFSPYTAAENAKYLIPLNIPIKVLFNEFTMVLHLIRQEPSSPMLTIEAYTFRTDNKLLNIPDLGFDSGSDFYFTEDSPEQGTIYIDNNAGMVQWKITKPESSITPCEYKPSGRPYSKLHLTVDQHNQDSINPGEYILLKADHKSYDQIFFHPLLKDELALLDPQLITSKNIFRVHAVTKEKIFLVENNHFRGYVSVLDDPYIFHKYTNYSASNGETLICGREIGTTITKRLSFRDQEYIPPFIIGTTKNGRSLQVTRRRHTDRNLNDVKLILKTVQDDSQKLLTPNISHTIEKGDIIQYGNNINLVRLAGLTYQDSSILYFFIEQLRG